MTQLSTIIKI